MLLRRAKAFSPAGSPAPLAGKAELTQGLLAFGRSENLWRLGVALATLLLLVTRRPDAFTLPQFWAEDARVFFVDARLLGWRSLFAPYAGYQHLYPRLVAYAVSVAPVALLPTLYLAANVAGVLFTALLCTSSRLELPTPVRYGLALAVTAAPVGNEVFHTLTNTQWILSLTLVLLLLFRPAATRAQWAFDLGLLLAVGLSGPFALLFSPFFVVRAAVRRDVHSGVLLAAVVAVTAVQLLALNPVREAGVFGPRQLEDSIHAWNGLLGRAFAGGLGRPAPEHPVFSWVFLGSGVLLYLTLLWDGAKRRSMAPFYLLGAGTAVMLAALYAFKGDPGLLKASGDRYFYIPTVLFVWTLIGAWPSAPRAAIPATLVTVLSCWTFFRSPAFPDHGWAQASRCLEGPGPCEFTVPPDWLIQTPAVQR